jgi:hypothetical protein
MADSAIARLFVFFSLPALILENPPFIAAMLDFIPISIAIPQQLYGLA